MDIVKLIQQIDDLFYEVFAILAFFPKTAWHMLARPQRMMDYADAELGDVLNEQYSDTISPPKFMMISLGISYYCNRLFQESTAVQALPGWLSNQEYLFAFGLLLYSITPLVISIRLVRKLGLLLDRSTLRPAFYSQCYLSGAVILISSAVTFLRGIELFDPTVAAVVKVCLAGWYLTQQALWFKLKLHYSYGRSIWLVMSSCAVSAACILALLVLAALT